MRLRTGHTPDAWSENEPAVAIRHNRSIEAATIPDMKPVLTYGGIYVENRKRTKVAQAFSIHIENRRDVCGVPMMRKFPDWKEPTGQTCGRLAGHRDTHRSRETMTEEAARRRTGHRV